MPTLSKLIGASLLVCSFLVFPALGQEEAEGDKLTIEQINNAAHLLAGMDPPHAGAEDLAGSQTFASHKSQLDREWNDYATRTLHPMSAWAAKEVAPYCKEGSVVRYMFSGPDILHAFHVFPKASTYIMCGLEPVGVAPDLRGMSAGNAGRAFSEVRNALGEIINFSFFRTKDMKTDLSYAVFRGTTPIMMVFLARSGQYVKKLEFFKLKDDGTLESLGDSSSGANVVKLTFSPRRVQTTKEVYYFSSDLSNEGFTKNGFSKFLEAQEKGNAYHKAASFLMHNSYFGDVRDHVLNHSVQIVQDDSGIPYRFFDKEKWDANLYGVYSGPIDLFSEFYQSDLRTAYRGGSTAIDFGTGYKWRRGESNLMRFVLKGTEKEELPVAEKEEPSAEKEEPATEEAN